MNIINFLRDLLHQPYFESFLSIVACLCFYYLKKEIKPAKNTIWLVYYLIFAITIFIFSREVMRAISINVPHDWDFAAFYLYGKVGASGSDFYLPENFHSVFNSIHLPLMDSKTFVDEVVNVGFPYPPPTILLFTPIGFLSYHTALIVWTSFILLFAIGSIYLIYNMYFKIYKLNGLILVAILFFLLLPVRLTVSFTQTNFILLFLLLLMKKHSDKKYAGILLTLALFTKPYMVIFVFIFVLKKQWKTIIYFITSSLVMMGLTLLLFGKDPFFSYLFNNSSKRLPAWVFSEPFNQSLHAVLLRSHLITIDKPMEFVYVVMGILLFAAFYLLYLVKRKLFDYIWAILLLIGLFLYPGTLTYYGVLLLFIIFQFFDEKKQLGFNKYLNIPIIGIFYYLSSVSVFSCICLLLMVTIIKSLKQLTFYKLNTT